MPSSSSVEVPEYETQFLPHSDDEDNLWEVVEILKESRERYYVKWGGVDPKTNKPWPDSWVPKEDCTDDLIREWKLRKAKMDQPKRKKRRTPDDLGM
ncbi:hypothetical protein M422DRAFT_161518 [Sphaerobolus stellatus SS14]|nr:hypothetical protein M422DRAFT_161518 [Sphaerobolus stellatus SS14]